MFAFAIAHGGRNHKHTLPAFLHARDSNVPALDDIPISDSKFKLYTRSVAEETIADVRTGFPLVLESKTEPSSSFPT